jgi:hypothetical protein
MNNNLPPASSLLDIKPDKQENETNPACFIDCLFHSRNQAHVFHLQPSSYAAHKALNEYYEAIIPMADTIAEAYAGRHGTIKGLGREKYTILEGQDKILPYFESLLKKVESMRYTCFNKEESNIQNEIDNVVTLICSIMFKLKNNPV